MKSFLEGRQTVSRQGLPVGRAAGNLPNLDGTPADSTVAMLDGFSPAQSRNHHGEKKIETVEVEGVIQKIIVTCACGEQIEVHCGY